jgi:hypothetical protein
LQTLIYIAYVLIIFVLNYQTKNSIINFKESNLETLLTLLARILRIEKQARFTIFQTEKNDENKITIIYRKHIGRNKAGYNDDFSFIDGEGLPGKAKQDPFIIGKTSNDSISFLRKLHISHLPDHLPKISSLSSLTPEIERNFKDFFKKTHNIESLKFGEMSSYKYKARSYLAVGLMPQSLKNTAVLVIDSENENVFLDLEMLKKLFSQAVFANITFEQLIVRKELRKLTTIKVGQALNLNEILFLLIQITNLIHQSIFRGNGDSYE